MGWIGRLGLLNPDLSRAKETPILVVPTVGLKSLVSIVWHIILLDINNVLGFDLHLILVFTAHSH